MSCRLRKLGLSGRNVTVKAHRQTRRARPPVSVQDIEARWADPSSSAGNQAPAASGLGSGQRPVILSCSIQRGVFF